MEKHLKTFEEYKYFKTREHGRDSEDRYYKNVKDPNEPFFNKKKGEYKTEQRNRWVLDPLNLTTEEFNGFLSKLRKRFYSIYVSPPEDYSDGDLKISLGGGSFGTIFFYPEEKLVTVMINKNKKKTFKFANKPNLDEILEFTYTLAEDPDEVAKRENDKYAEEKRRVSSWLKSEDEPSITPYKTEDTTTFDSYRYRR